MQSLRFQRHITGVVTLPFALFALNACSNRNTDSRDSAGAMSARVPNDTATMRTDSAGAMGASTAMGASPAMASPSAMAPMTDTLLANLALTVDRGEVEAGRLASTKARNAQVKAYARTMVAAHQTDLSATSKLVRNGKMAMMDSTGPQAGGASSNNIVLQTMDKQRETMESLRSATGDAFDRAYIDAMVSGHQAFLTQLQQNNSSSTMAAPLKQHFQKLQQDVTEHLQRAKTIQDHLSSRAGDTTAKP